MVLVLVRLRLMLMFWVMTKTSSNPADFWPAELMTLTCMYNFLGYGCKNYR